jgi:hypothetical protein
MFVIDVSLCSTFRTVPYRQKLWFNISTGHYLAVLKLTKFKIFLSNISAHSYLVSTKNKLSNTRAGTKGSALVSMWMRSRRVVRVSENQCQVTTVPGSIPASSDTGAADEAVLNIVLYHTGGFNADPDPAFQVNADPYLDPIKDPWF